MKYQHTLRLLQQIEMQLKSLQLWSIEAPSAAALASTAPFACDSMTLEQWLQFIFLPRMQQMIELQQPLPTHCGIYPMAEIVWTPLTADKVALFRCFKELDTVLSATTPSPFEHH